MTVFIALLRGINVGGHNKVKMADLKNLLESIGLIRVETYIQSGNALFESGETEEALREKMECGLENAFGFPVPVILRTAGELNELIHACPFSPAEVAQAEAANTEGESLYVALLSEAPSPEMIDYLNSITNEKDVCRILNRDIYLLLRQSIRNSKLANSFQKLDVPFTVRNWKTLNRLNALASSRTTI